MRVLLTRPAAESEALARSLGALGHAPILCPLLEIRPLAGAAIELGGVQALLFTSAAGVRTFAAGHPSRTLPVFVVGDATAAVAQELGFSTVRSARGDGAELAQLAIDSLDPTRGVLLHASSADVAGDLDAALGRAGFDYRRAVVYEAVPAAVLPHEGWVAVASGAFEAALFFSPRTASTFVSLVKQAGLADMCRAADALCLSAAVAAEAAALHWRAVLAAGSPDQASLLALLASREQGR